MLDLPDGERTLIARLDALRAQVEQARYARHSLAAAEAALDRKLALAAHRRAQVGFVRDALAAAELGHLPDTLAGVTAAMDGIQAHVADIEVAQPSIPADDGWETGRQAYLSWAVGRALAPETGLAAVEGEARALGSTAEVEALGRTASGRA